MAMKFSVVGHENGVSTLFRFEGFDMGAHEAMIVFHTRDGRRMVTTARWDGASHDHRVDELVTSARATVEHRDAPSVELVA